jgi:hypothetical protein
MIALTDPTDQCGEDLSAIPVWVDEIRYGAPRLRGLELDVLSLPAHRAHEEFFSRQVTKPLWSVLASVWTSARDCLDLPTPPGPFTAVCVEVCEHRAFGLEKFVAKAGATPGLKKTTFWKAPTGLANTVWQRRYRAHVAAVQQHHSAWAYRQNLIKDKPPSFPFDAISENWWANVNDLCESFYLSETGRRAVSDEVAGFIDFGAVAAVVSQHTVIVPLEERRAAGSRSASQIFSQ